MKKNGIDLVCKSVTFHARKDEDAFFEWIQKIGCINNFSGAGRELYLHIPTTDLDNTDLKDLIGLLYRYNIDMKQLKVFVNDKNKNWFCDNKNAYWHRKVFGD